MQPALHTRQQAWAAKVLADELNEVRSPSKGGGLNKALFKSAARLYSLAEEGIFSPDELSDQLWDAGIAAGNPKQSVKDTLRSAQRAASRSSAKLPDWWEGESTSVALEPTPPHLEPCEAPGEAWQKAGRAFVEYAERHLWSDLGDGAWDWLAGRGFRESTIGYAKLGYNPTPLTTSRAKWGLAPEPENANPDALTLAAGVVIPYFIGGELWKIEIRRLIVREGEKKYRTVAGSSNALYNADALRPGFPAAVCEGAFDALAIHQSARELIAPVACATTTGARKVRWIARLAAARPVLVTMDADAAGEVDGAAYWLGVLGAAGRRWAPIVDDPATMLRMGFDVRGWVCEGLA